MELDELVEHVEHFTLLPDEVARLRNKSGPTRLGFALLLKFFTHRGRFPAGRGEPADEVVEFVAKQVLQFRSSNATHRPVIEALELVSRYAAAGNLSYYPAGEHVPAHPGSARGLGAAGAQGRQARPPPHRAHGLRGVHVPGAARTAALQEDLGGRCGALA